MLKLTDSSRRKQSGDTLIEVTFALAILGTVLLSSSVIATTAFRTGQTARERTQLATQAQGQMEALRSFRDNHTWAQFRNGTGAYNGVDTVGAPFHMEYKTTVAGVQEWVPVAGVMPASMVAVPSESIGIRSVGSASARACGYDFELSYKYDALAGATAPQNTIKTRLVNLKYTPGTPGGCLP
jgi:hypothetical protein